MLIKINPEEIASQLPSKKVKNNRIKFLSESTDTDIENGFGKIEMGFDYHFSTENRWSLHQIIIFLLKEIGPADLYFATWSIKPTQANLIAELKQIGAITTIYALLDYRININSPEANDIIIEVADQVGYMRTHAKLFVLENENFQIAYIGSANLTTNTSADVGVICCNKEVAAFRKDWILNNIKK